MYKHSILAGLIILFLVFTVAAALTANMYLKQEVDRLEGENTKLKAEVFNLEQSNWQPSGDEAEVAQYAWIKDILANVSSANITFSYDENGKTHGEITLIFEGMQGE